MVVAPKSRNAFLISTSVHSCCPFFLSFSLSFPTGDMFWQLHTIEWPLCRQNIPFEAQLFEQLGIADLILQYISLILTSLQILPGHTDYITAFADGAGKYSQPSMNTVPRKPNVSSSNWAAGETGLSRSCPLTPQLRGNVGLSLANSEGSLPPVGSV